MGEEERLVGVAGDDEVGEVARQAQLRHGLERAPVAGRDKDGAAGGDGADDGDGGGVKLVHALGGGGVARLVEQLEDELVVGDMFVVAGNNIPAGVPPRDLGGGGLFGERVEVVPVEDDVQAGAAGLVDQAVDLAENGGVDGPLRAAAQVVVPGDGQAHVVEAGGANLAKILRAVSAVAPGAGRGFPGVAEVDAAAQALDGAKAGLVAPGGGVGDGAGREEDGEAEQQEGGSGAMQGAGKHGAR